MTEDSNVMDRLLAAIVAGDLDGVRACFTPDGEVWHGYDCIAHDVNGFVASVKGVAAAGIELRYDDVRRHPTPTGFVQQHLLVTPDAEGGYSAKPCCVVVELKDGRIHRALEYLDRTGVVKSLTVPMVTPGL
ncbi:nuclear transport factor 2 family protein [Sphingobium tyrosinilyticum]|uniref:Nuclear transport factor 2 family protein n=1 Tax=Sphingobium tyrosinilyticum TaxID=2715436 RepID=A0ABV9F391_9SPHN